MAWVGMYPPLSRNRFQNSLRLSTSGCISSMRDSMVEPHRPVPTTMVSGTDCSFLPPGDPGQELAPAPASSAVPSVVAAFLVAGFLLAARLAAGFLAAAALVPAALAVLRLAAGFLAAAGACFSPLAGAPVASAVCSPDWVPVGCGGTVRPGMPRSGTFFTVSRPVSIASASEGDTVSSKSIRVTVTSALVGSVSVAKAAPAHSACRPADSSSVITRLRISENLCPTAITFQFRPYARGNQPQLQIPAPEAPAAELHFSGRNFSGDRTVTAPPVRRNRCCRRVFNCVMTAVEHRLCGPTW